MKPALLKIQDLQIHAGSNSLVHLPNLHLESGEMHGVVGESGSGKTTLLALLRGLYEPEKDVVVKMNDRHRCAAQRCNAFSARARNF